MKTIALCVTLMLILSCAPSKPKEEIPPLTPQSAAALLQFDNKAHAWMEFVKRNNTGCEYSLELPDQRNQPSEIDLDHIVSCQGRPAPKQFDASVVFVYDKQANHWIVQRFLS